MNRLGLALLLATLSTDSNGQGFEKLVLTDRYYCDGIAAEDIDRDGTMDIVAGPFIYFGPDFQSATSIYPPEPLDPALSPSNSMFSFVHDFNGDAYPDVLVLGRVHRHQAFWYENPGVRNGAWKKHFAFHRVKGESPTMADIDADGRPDVLTHNEQYWGWITPDPKDPKLEWMFKPFSERGEWPQFYHGMGLGDLDQDGRLDVILNEGWYRQPESSSSSGNWTKHPFVFSEDRGGAQMFAYDVDGDRDQDVISSLNAHEWGMAWFENRGNGKSVRFIPHRIMGTRDEEQEFGVAFSQPHALALGDLNRDGLVDIVAGKRRWAHGPDGDVEPNASPVVYWFELTRSEPGGARYIPHLIDDQSGVGVQIAVKDVNDDGFPDVLTTSKLGTFVFLNRLAGSSRQ